MLVVLVIFLISTSVNLVGLALLYHFYSRGTMDNYHILDDMADVLRENFKDLVPLIKGDKLLVIHRSRGVLLELTVEDEATMITKIVGVYEKRN